MKGHEQEVCGLKWSPSGTQLASGGNDNLLHVWSASGRYQLSLMNPAVLDLQETAAHLERFQVLTTVCCIGTK